ncbi:hypothetical protein FHX81_4945 [Saccharothrix saharensis]|uniref:Uncharacterized protein n=1 Tax=Saccharothrix saharensis TaxID=571190 RepID=A0A543JI72_9PSEU|nr:hypothetical protein [Saccharothrix saharensis]TQM82537.1 hypothetical protein FHX81_4945 [Saccharothrix saharensis]
METEFKVLGPLEVWHGGRQVALPTGKARVLPATLPLRAGDVVPTGVLVDRLWDGRSANPGRARATLRLGDTHAPAGDHAAAREAWQAAPAIPEEPGHGNVAALRAEAAGLP